MIQPITNAIMTDRNSDISAAETIACRDNVILRLIHHKVGLAVIADAFGVPRYYVARLASKISSANVKEHAPSPARASVENKSIS